MNRFTKILAAAILAAGALAFVAPVYAEDNTAPEGELETTSIEAPAEGESASTEEIPSAPAISMKPTNQTVTFSPDETIDSVLTVSNPGNTTYSFKVYAQPYTISDENDSYTFAFNTSNAYSDIASWITFEDESGNFVDTATFRLAPGEYRDINYQIVTPANAPAGGQYAAIFAETINEEAATSSINGVYTVSRVALLVYARSAEGAVLESSIQDYTVKSFLTSGPITATSRVTTLGNTDITATYKISVRGIFGNDLYSNTWSYPVLPDTTRYVVMTWEDTPPFGIFSVQYSVSTADQLEDRTTIVLIFPVWLMVFAILLLTIIAMCVIMGIKKRKERKSRLIV